MNMNYLLSGTVSSNPILLAIAILLVLAWKTAGWWGLDRWVLPALGTPWRPGLIFRHQGGRGERRSLRERSSEV
jgi:thiosulfate dehydrogenase [quinone] large subunit